MKKFSLITLLLLIAFSNVFAISITYKDTLEGYDSDVLLKQFREEEIKKIEQEAGVSDIGIVFWGPGAYPHLYYGHVGLVVEFDNGRNILYDYGVFNPSEKGFVKEVIHGRMFYELSATPISINYLFAISENSGRSMHYYILNGLDNEKKEFIANFLLFNYSENRHKYLYNFFSDNCSTRVRDILDVVYDGKLSELGSRPYGTRRMSIEEQTAPHTAVEIIYGIAEGYLQDKPITYYDAMFLPSYLEMALNELRVIDNNYNITTARFYNAYKILTSEDDADTDDEFYNENRLVSAITLKQENTWEDKYPYGVSFNTHNSRWFPLILIALIFALLNFFRTIIVEYINNKIIVRIANKLYAFINAFVLLFIFILSLAMLFLQFYTLIDCGWKNENSIFVSPLVIFMIFYAFKTLFVPSKEKERKAIKKLSLWATVMFFLTLLALILKLVLPHQQNMLHITAFGLYYLSLMQIDKNTIIKIKQSISKRREKNENWS